MMCHLNHVVFSAPTHVSSLCNFEIVEYMVSPRPTWVFVECSRHIFCRVTIRCVADDKTRFTNSTISHQNTFYTLCIAVRLS